MEDGSAHVWWLVRRGEVRVMEVSGRSSAVLVMSSLAQLLVLLCGDMYLYSSHGQWEIVSFIVMGRSALSIFIGLAMPEVDSCLNLGTHSLNEELGRHRRRNGMTECVLGGDECESVVHVLWECPAYKDSREEFLVKLRATLGEAFKDFKALDNIERALFVLGCELGRRILILCLL